MTNTRLYGRNTRSFHPANDIIVLYEMTQDTLILKRIGSHATVLGHEFNGGAG